jgi:CRISPR-associated protein Cas1
VCRTPLTRNSFSQPNVRRCRVSFLLVDLDGCQIARDAERVVVRDGALVLAEYLPHEIDCVVAWGRVEITRPAMEMLLSRGCPIHLVGRNGRYQGCVMPGERDSARLRRAQYAAVDDPPLRLALARVATAAELQNLRVVLKRWRIHQDCRLLDDGVRHIAELVQMLNDAVTINEIRGLEGNAWRASYEALAAIAPQELGFATRRRRPAPDPLNAVLGLYGSLTAHAAASMLLAVGLDPGVGYMHGSARNGPALALDLCDVYRPLVCLAPAVSLFTKHVLSAGDFAGLGYSATLTRDGMRKALRVYAQTFRREVRRPGASTPRNYLWHLQHDAEALANLLAKGDGEWRPLRVR